MNYAYQINKINSLVEHYTQKPDFVDSELLSSKTTEFKKSAYNLFYELIKLKKTHIYQEPNHVHELFSLIKGSTAKKNIELKVLDHVEHWWLEWYFALEMDEKLSIEKSDMPMSYLPQSTLNPMRKHEISHYARLFTVLPMPVCNVCSKTGDIFCR
ncbi:hypothetical protein LCGC14_3153240 [marine sediment metagenome]|uniref:Uncharacterized protein n=1 Tax=marine sediment metagenome TaxID=412755 RepID=A0A0F8VTH1_9ZZZZ